MDYVAITALILSAVSTTCLVIVFILLRRQREEITKVSYDDERRLEMSLKQLYQALQGEFHHGLEELRAEQIRNHSFQEEQIKKIQEAFSYLLKLQGIDGDQIKRMAKGEVLRGIREGYGPQSQDFQSIPPINLPIDGPQLPSQQPQIDREERSKRFFNSTKTGEKNPSWDLRGLAVRTVHLENTAELTQNPEGFFQFVDDDRGNYALVDDHILAPRYKRRLDETQVKEFGLLYELIGPETLVGNISELRRTAVLKRVAENKYALSRKGTLVVEYA